MQKPVQLVPISAPPHSHRVRRDARFATEGERRGRSNQNDIGKAFYGGKDLLADAFPGRDPTSLLVWALKAKTVADPIGYEEQLLNPAQRGALVDLRTAPHEVCAVRVDGQVRPVRLTDGATSCERAFGDQGNFVTAPDGADIPGNRGTPWPEPHRSAMVWR